MVEENKHTALFTHRLSCLTNEIPTVKEYYSGNWQINPIGLTMNDKGETIHIFEVSRKLHGMGCIR